MNKKVVHISPYRLTKGGISTVVKQYDEYGIPGGYDIIAVDSHSDGSKFRKAFIALKALLRIMGMAVFSRPDLMHVHVGDFPSIYRKMAVTFPFILMRVDGILHLHGADFMAEYDAQSAFGKKLVKWYMGRFDDLICLSNSWGKVVGETFNIPNMKIVYNAVAERNDQRPRREPGSPLRLCFLGLIGRRKGIFDLLDVVSELISEEGCDIRLSIGGNGRVEDLQAVIADKGVGASVKYLGWVTGQEKEAVLLESDAMVLPSYAEGMPMSVLEGMSFGLPIISTEVGGIPELVHNGVSGFLITPGDKGALKSAIKELYADRSSVEKMGKASKAIVAESFSYAVHSAEIGRVYGAVLGRRG